MPLIAQPVIPQPIIAQPVTVQPVMAEPERRPLPSRRRDGPRPAGLALLFVLSAGLAVGVAGCASPPPAAAAGERHPIRVDLAASELALTVDPATGRLADAERDRVARAVAVQAGDTALHVAIAGRPLARPARAAVAALLGAAGVPADNVAFTPDGTPGTTLFLTRYAAVPPDCRRWGDINEGWSENTPTGILGCSNQRNLALMLADPRDLLEGRATRPADGARMAGSVQRYRADRVKKLPSEAGTNGFLLAPGLAAAAPEAP